MNDEVLTPDDIRLLDRLVDGELNETERRNLLLRLEHSHDGWRRCALAFLEAQAWKLEARAVVAEPAPSVKPTIVQAATPQPAELPSVQPASVARKTWNGLSLWMPTVLAAGILVAVVYPQWGGRFTKNTFEPVAKTEPAQVSGPGVAPVGGRGAENLQLVVAPGPNGERRVVDVPLIEPEKMNAELFGHAATQLPPDVVKILEQNGNRVVRQQRLMPVRLGDGRTVVVPVEQVEIRPLGNQGFQ